MTHQRGEFPRNETFYKIRLAEELHQHGHTDDACHTATEAIPALTALHSTRTRTRAARFFTTIGNRRSRAARDAFERAHSAGLIA